MGGEAGILKVPPLSGANARICPVILAHTEGLKRYVHFETRLGVVIQQGQQAYLLALDPYSVARNRLPYRLHEAAGSSTSF
jgi:hypothetical protein